MFPKISPALSFFSFCATRWVEDEDVVVRAILIWPNMVKITKHWESLCKSKRPKNKSYETLVKFYTDVFVPLRMQFFKDLAKKLKGFLVQYQTDWPMVPFLSDSLEELVRSLMNIILKPDVVKKANSAYLLTTVDVAISDNQLELYQMKFGTALKQMMVSLNSRPEKKRAFQQECKQIVVVLLQKLQEKSPLKYAVVRNASSLSPKNMIQMKTKSISRFEKLVERLSKLNWITTDESDDAKLQYEKFINTECTKHMDKFESFDRNTTRLDAFFGSFMHNNKEYTALWKVCSYIFVLSHGQSSTERGFSINKQLLVENLQEKSLVSQRIVYDHINSNNVAIHQYQLPNDLVKSCKLAHSRYIADLKESKLNKAKEDSAGKRKLLNEEIVAVKKKKEDIEKCITILRRDADKLSSEAEEKRDFNLLTEANSFRKTASEKEKDIENLDKALKKLEQSKKELE